MEVRLRQVDDDQVASPKESNQHLGGVEARVAETNQHLATPE